MTTSEKIEKSVERFLARRKIKFDWTATGYQRDDSGWEYQSFVVTIERKGKSFEFPWKQGLGCNCDPHATSVISCLMWDLHSSSMDFDSWCSELGYSNDSIKALNTYKLCNQQAERLMRIFTHKEIVTLSELTQDY